MKAEEEARCLVAMEVCLKNCATLGIHNVCLLSCCYGGVSEKLCDTRYP